MHSSDAGANLLDLDRGPSSLSDGAGHTLSFACGTNSAFINSDQGATVMFKPGRGLIVVFDRGLVVGRVSDSSRPRRAGLHRGCRLVAIGRAVQDIHRLDRHVRDGALTMPRHRSGRAKAARHHASPHRSSLADVRRALRTVEKFIATSSAERRALVKARRVLLER